MVVDLSGIDSTGACDVSDIFRLTIENNSYTSQKFTPRKYFMIDKTHSIHNTTINNSLYKAS